MIFPHFPTPSPPEKTKPRPRPRRPRPSACANGSGAGASFNFFFIIFSYFRTKGQTRSSKDKADNLHRNFGVLLAYRCNNGGDAECRPKTLDAAAAALKTVAAEIAAAEAAEAAALAETKERSGGWRAVGEAREALAQLKDRADRAFAEWLRKCNFRISTFR